MKHELTSRQGALKSKQSKEGSEQGKVKWDVYMEYAKTSNLSAVAVYLTMLLGAQAAQIGEFSNCIFSTRMPAHGVDLLGCNKHAVSH